MDLADDKFSDFPGKHVILSIEKNFCTCCSHDLVLKKNEHNHILVDSEDGENIIQSRILDKTTILVSGMFFNKEVCARSNSKLYYIS